MAALRANAGKVSDKLKYAYLPEQSVGAMGIDRNEYCKLKSAHKKVENMFFKMGGNRSTLRKVILSGKRKNLSGFEILNGGISRINELGGFEKDLGFKGTESENQDYIRWVEWSIHSLPQTQKGAQPFRKKEKKLKIFICNSLAKDLLNKIQLGLKDIDGSKLVKQQKRKQVLLNALYHNYHNISIILAQGYFTQSEADAEGIPASDWQKNHLALENTKKLYKDEFNGNEAELKKTILLGKTNPILKV